MSQLGRMRRTHERSVAPSCFGQPVSRRRVTGALFVLIIAFLAVPAFAQEKMAPFVDGLYVSSPPQGGDTWFAGEEMRVSVRFHEAVEVTGTPRIALTIGDRTVFANYNSHNDRWVYFRYTVLATDRDPDGLSIASAALTLNGGTIEDASGNAANLWLGRHAIANDPRHKVDGSAADTVRPRVTGIWLSPPPQGGDTWLADEEMQVRVFFNEAVEVTGTPRVALTIGDRTAFANYDWHSNRAVQFRYTVRSTDRDPDGLSIASAALTLNGGTIEDASGNAANLSLGSYSIANDPRHKVDGVAADTVPPSVTRTWISSPPQGGDTWLADEEMEIQVTFNEPVDVTGTPRLALTIGDRSVFANYYRLSESRVYFRYTVQVTDRDPDGISIAAGALTLNGGRIADASGNAADLSLGSYAITNDQGHKVDGSAADTARPRVTGIWLSPPPQGGDTWLADEEMQVRVFFNEAVEVAGTPRVALTIGDRTAFANYDWYSDRAVQFRYTVRSTDRDPDGLSIASAALTLNGGTIEDASGNAANLSLGRHAIANDPRHKVDGSAADTVRPRVTGIWLSPPPQGGDTWLADEEMQVRVFFNEAVEVTGTPRVALTIGDRTAFANYDWHSNRAVQFRYTVRSTDRDPDGLSIASAALTLNGGTIEDGAGNAANLSLGSYSIANDPEHKVDGAAADTVPPSVTGTGISSPPQGGDTWLAGEEIRVSVRFGEAVEVTGTPRLALTIGDRRVFASYSSHNDRWVNFGYTVQATDRDPDGLSIASAALTLNGGTIEDGAGNAANLSLGSYSIANDPEHKVDGAAADTVPPRVTRIILSQPADGEDTWHVFQHLEVFLDFNEPVHVTGRPRLALRIGEVIAEALHIPPTFVTGVRPVSRVRFRHVIRRTDVDENGISLGADAVLLNGGTIRDGVGNDADLDLTAYAFEDHPDHKVDAGVVGPRVAWMGIAAPPPQGGDTWFAGEKIEVQLRFTEEIVVSGTPRLVLTIGDQPVRADYGGVWKTRRGVNFEYVVQPGDRDDDGLSIAADALLLGEGAIRDDLGNPVEVDLSEHPIQDDPRHKVNGGDALSAVRAGVSSVAIVSSPENASTYAAGEEIRVRVRFSREVIVSGRPGMGLRLGDETRVAHFDVQEAGNELVFAYTVAAEDWDTDGISLGPDALEKSRGALRVRQGGYLDSDLSGHEVPDNPDHRVAGAPARLSGLRIQSAPANGDSYRLGEVIEVAAEFDRPVAAFGTPRIALTVGAAMRAAEYADSAEGDLIFRYWVAQGDWDADGISIGADALQWPEGVVRGELGLAAHVDHAGIPDQPDHRVRAVSGPEIVRPLPSLRLVVGAAPALSELSGAFTGARNYDAGSSRPNVAAASVSGSSLQVAPLSEGEAEITVTGSNEAGSVTQRFRVEVIGDPAEVQAVEEAMEALSRSLLTSATDVIRARMESGMAPAPTSAASVSASWNRAHAGETDSGGVRALFLAGSPAEGQTYGNGRSTLDRSPDRFELSLAPRNDDAAGPGIRWTIWGTADHQSARLGMDAEPGYESQLRSPYVGVDAAGERWLAGVAAARSFGTAEYRYHGETRGTGKMDTRLTGIHPYLSIAVGDRMEIWGIMGVGGGDFDVDRSATDERESGSLRMWMGTIGARRSLATARGIRLSLRGDAGVARLSTKDVQTGVARGLSVGMRRMRLGAEAALRRDLSDVVTITPSVEVSGRFDAGDHLEGTGLEAAGGLRLTAGSRFEIEGRGRMLLAHSQRAYEEKGASLAARLLPDAEGRGFSLAMTPRWGAGGQDSGALWRTGTVYPGDAGVHIGGPDSGSTIGHAGYGFAVGQLPGIFQFFGGFDRSGGDRHQVRTGARYELRDGGERSLDIELIGDRMVFGARTANRISVHFALRY